MNAFIKYLGKKVADYLQVEILDETAFLERVQDALITIVSARLFIEDAKARGIVQDVKDGAE